MLRFGSHLASIYEIKIFISLIDLLTIFSSKTWSRRKYEKRRNISMRRSGDSKRVDLTVSQHLWSTQSTVARRRSLGRHVSCETRRVISCMMIQVVYRQTAEFLWNNINYIGWIGFRSLSIFQLIPSIIPIYFSDIHFELKARINPSPSIRNLTFSIVIEIIDIFADLSAPTRMKSLSLYLRCNRIYRVPPPELSYKRPAISN